MKQPKSVRGWAVATKGGKLVGNPWNSRVPYIFSSERACRTMACGVGETVVAVLITPIPKKGKP